MLGRALKDVKLPFPDDFFPEVIVSNEDDVMYRRAAQSKVLETLRDENPATRFHPAQRTDQWKLIGDRLGVQLYRERGVAQGNAVQVVCVGGLNGSLEDVMWGLYAATTPAFKTQRSILHNTYLDACVLHVLDEEDCDEEDTAFSYRFSGIKWLATASSGKLTMHKRDLCWHETMGLVHDAAGQEVGYLTIQSVRINECPPFEQFGLVRSNANVCFIFRKQPNGSVGVYMKGEHAVGGKSRSWGSDPLIVETWLSIANALDCAHAKRLTRLLRGKDLFCATQNKQCEICDQKVRGLKSSENCKICGKNVCDKCRMSKAIYPNKNTLQFPCMAMFCKRCLSEVKDRSSAHASRMSFHSDNASSSHSSGSSAYHPSFNNPATMLYTNNMGPPQARNGPPTIGRTGSVGSNIGSRPSSAYQPHYSEGTVHSNSPTASIGGLSYASSDYSNFSDSGIGGANSFRQPRQQQQRYQRGPVSRDPQIMPNYRTQPQQQRVYEQVRRPSQPFNGRYQSSSIDSTHDVDSLDASFQGRMRLSSNPLITDMNDNIPVIDFPSRQTRATTSGGIKKKHSHQYMDVSDLHDNEEDEDDEIDGVIELSSRVSPVEPVPVDVFHEDKLKYINSFSSDSSGNIANPSLSGSGTGASSSGPKNERQMLMERLLQANMTAEATYLLAKYSNNLAKNGTP